MDYVNFVTFPNSTEMVLVIVVMRDKPGLSDMN